ncbi:hypothetical protein [Paractinoplanes durhamensis]|uniref:hypothetical protein n=1 Tax=Paractinoplanes durhamensis TaxID=113563 RepID=UPI0036456F3D
MPTPARPPMPQTTSVAIRAELLPRRRAMPSTTNRANTITPSTMATAVPSHTTAM